MTKIVGKILDSRRLTSVDKPRGWGFKKLMFAVAISLASVVAWAKPQTVTLDLPTMNCSVCPITVKKALNNVEGVSKTEVSYENKEAVVTFEDTKTNTEALVKATTNAGYPSTVKE